MRLNSSNDYGKDGNMSNSIYYKATDEDGNTVLKHALEKNKYLCTKNGKHVYPEDVNKEVKIVKNVAKRDTSEKSAATKYFPDKASKLPTANAARVKANSVKSNAEYKLTNDVKSSGAYKSAKKEINRIPKNVNKAYESAKSSIPTAAEVRNKANSVKSKAEYKLTRAGEKLTNDVKRSGAYKSAKKGINNISRDANKAYKSAKKGINSISRDANKAYKSAKKKAKKVNRTFNKVKRAGKAYIDYLTK